MKIWKIAFPTGYSVDWSNVDWSKSNPEISNSLGVKPNTVSDNRSKYAPETLNKSYDWGTVDWSKPNIEIRNETGMSEPQIISMRRRYAPETIGPYNWAGLDWSKSNKEISESMGIPMGSIAFERKRHAPETIDRTIQKKNIDWSDVKWELTQNVEIASQKGVSQSTVSHMRAVLAPETMKESLKRKICDWANLDYSRSNKELAKLIVEKSKRENNGEVHFSEYSLPIAIERNRRRYAPETIHSEGVRSATSYNWYKMSQSPTTLTCWHISNSKFNKFNPNKTAQGIIWFAKDKEDLLVNLHGASINSRLPIYLYECSVNMGKTAGWDEYHKYLLMQLRDMKYDTIELDGDIAVLNEKAVTIVGVTKVK